MKSVLHQTFNPAGFYDGLFTAGPKAEQAMESNMRLIVPKEYRSRVKYEKLNPAKGLPNGGIRWSYTGKVLEA